MKKLFTICALLLVIIMLFSACAPAADTENTSAEGNVNSSSTSVSENYKIITVPKMIGIAWWDRALEGDKAYENETGNEVIQMGPTTPDAALQVGVLQDAIAQSPDILCVVPVSPDAIDPLLLKAKEAGIPTISHEAPTLKNVDFDVEAFGNEEYGAYLMDKLAEFMNEEGEYAIMVGGLTMEAHQSRAKGAIDRQKEKYPNMVLATDLVEGNGQDVSYTKTKELLTAYPNLKGILGFDAVNPPGIALAVEEAGKSGKVQVVGTSLVSMAKPFLESGSCQLINFWDPYEVERAMCAVGVLLKEGKEIKSGDNLGVPGYENIVVEGNVIIGKAWIDVTIENIDDYNF